MSSVLTYHKFTPPTVTLEPIQDTYTGNVIVAAPLGIDIPFGGAFQDLFDLEGIHLIGEAIAQIGVIDFKENVVSREKMLSFFSGDIAAEFAKLSSLLSSDLSKKLKKHMGIESKHE